MGLWEYFWSLHNEQLIDRQKKETVQAFHAMFPNNAVREIVDEYLATRNEVRIDTQDIRKMTHRVDM